MTQFITQAAKCTLAIITRSGYMTIVTILLCGSGLPGQSGANVSYSPLM